MIGDNEAWDNFISEHRWAVLTTLTNSGSPSSSVVAYARDADELVISTPGHTFKRTSIESDPRVNLCVLSNTEPFNFVAIQAHATVVQDNLAEDTIKVFANIESVGYSLPDPLDAWLEKEQRVILRLLPERVHGVIR